jgi:hypothetical protein
MRVRAARPLGQDRSHQGVLNHLLVTKLLAGAFANDSAVIFNGRSVVDPTIKYYWGISQGGILVRAAPSARVLVWAPPPHSRVCACAGRGNSRARWCWRSARTSTVAIWGCPVRWLGSPLCARGPWALLTQRAGGGASGGPYPILLARSVDFDPYLYVGVAHVQSRVPVADAPRPTTTQRGAQGAVRRRHRPHPAPVDAGPAVGPRRAGRLYEYARRP